MSGQGGRYQRSPSGMVGAMIVLLLAIGAFVAFRSVTRAELATDPNTVDYLSTVRVGQADGGLKLLYPPELPEGWRATTAEYQKGRSPRWEMGILTDDGTFVGVQQAKSSSANLVEQYVDEGATEGAMISFGSPRRPWTEFADEGGDVAVVTVLSGGSGSTVLVYGSAAEAEILDFAASLVSAPAVEP